MNVSLVPTCTSIHTGPVPLKLATSKISHGNKQIDVNIDKGVQRTYVTESAIKKLSIHDADCKCEFLNISTFGSSVSQQKHVNIAQIKLHTRKPGEKLNINALIVPRISTPVKSIIDFTIQKHDYLNQLPLACGVVQDVFKIDLHVGADYYWQIIGDQIIRGLGSYSGCF